MAIVSDERAGEIRGELCKQYPGTWLHEYHKAIEAEVLANARLTILPNQGPIGDLLSACKEGWRHADELEQERLRLNALNAKLLAALKGMVAGHEDACTGYGEGAADLAREAIAECERPAEPSVQHLPSDDTEGGAL